MQFHANNEQILNYCDENLLDVEVKQHINTCDECVQRVEDLKILSNLLNATEGEELSELELSASWDTISTSLETPQKSKQKRPLWLAFVASTVFAILFSVQSFKSQAPIKQEVVLAPLNADALELSVSEQQASELDQLLAYSRLIENRLQTMPQPRVVRANTAGTISNLQDHISMLDTRLSMQHQAPLTEQQQTALWQQRVNSMNNLYRVRAAQLQRVNY